MDKNFWGSVRGMVETLEQKSGLNSLLYLDAIIALPCLVLYGITSNSVFMAIVWLLVVFTLFIYGVAFTTDRNFLRSEKHVKEMKQLDLLGEKNKELPGENILDIKLGENPEPKNDKRLTGGRSG